MATTTASSLQADVAAYLARETLPISQKVLVVRAFAQQSHSDTIPRGHGTVVTYTRYNRLALPYSPLGEGVPAIAQGLTIQQVTGTVQQWGGLVTITDVAELTIFHNPFQKAKELSAIQLAETLERNTFLTLMGLTQVNYVNNKGSRANLSSGDVLDPFTVNRTYAALADIRAPQWNGPDPMNPNPKLTLTEGQPRAGSSPRSMPHYAAVSRIFPIEDLRQNPQVVNAWSFNDINKLYNAEMGEWGGIRWCESNMCPSFVGVAAVTGTGGASGTLADGTYHIQLTGVDTQNQYEQRIYQVSGNIVLSNGSAIGSISVTTPNIAGFTFNAYIGTSTSPQNLALSTSGPTTGPMAGQAVQLPANTTVVLTGIGLAQTPPAAPSTGVTVYPIFVFGQDAFGAVKLEGGSVDWSYLNQAEKSDPQNQLRMVAWKIWDGQIILNAQFAARIEAASAFGPAFG